MRATCGAGGRAKVPLLEAGGRVLVESIDIARDLARNSRLYPPGDAALIDGFIKQWCGDVEGAYYSVLRAESETQARSALAGLISALARLEESFWAQRMQRR